MAAFLLRGVSAPSRPDIVLVVWDTCRSDRLSCYGGLRRTTPRLDAFAAGAVRYSRCFAPAPWTAPSHGSLFTGLMPSKHGLRVGRGDEIPTDIPLLAETLARSGYATIGVSANPVVSTVNGLSRGFRSFDLVEDGTGEHDAALVVRGAEAALARRDADPAEGRKPLFLFLNFMDLHLPHHPPAAALDALGRGGFGSEELARAGVLDTAAGMAISVGAEGLGGRTAAALKLLYDADLLYLDAEMGRLFDRLRERGILDRALVVVAGDHGDNLGEHGQLGHRLSMLDTLLHVPLVVRLPGEFDGGKVAEGAVSLMDVYPTILRTAGVPVPPGTGQDSLPLSVSGEGASPRVLTAEHGPHLAYLAESRAVRPEAAAQAFEPLRWMFQTARPAGGADASWKFQRILRQEDDGRFTPVSRELFDLDVDPGEERNLLGEGASAAARAIADSLEGSLAPATVPR